MLTVNQIQQINDILEQNYFSDINNASCSFVVKLKAYEMMLTLVQTSDMHFITDQSLLVNCNECETNEERIRILTKRVDIVSQKQKEMLAEQKETFGEELYPVLVEFCDVVTVKILTGGCDLFFLQVERTRSDLMNDFKNLFDEAVRPYIDPAKSEKFERGLAYSLKHADVITAEDVRFVVFDKIKSIVSVMKMVAMTLDVKDEAKATPLVVAAKSPDVTPVNAGFSKITAPGLSVLMSKSPQAAPTPPDANVDNKNAKVVSL